MQLVDKLDQYTNYSKKFYIHEMDKYANEIPWTLSHMWVNYMSKYEYNPLHVHNGLYSWVLWYKIPYMIENEVKYSSKNSETSGDDIVANGNFAFIHTTNPLKVTALPVDNKFEGYIAVFPSTLAHVVYPFYTSDEYRITLSGNVENYEYNRILSPPMDNVEHNVER